MRRLDYLIKFWFFINHGEIIKKAKELCNFIYVCMYVYKTILL